MMDMTRVTATQATTTAAFVAEATVEQHNKNLVFYWHEAYTTRQTVGC